MPKELVSILLNNPVAFILGLIALINLLLLIGEKNKNKQQPTPAQGFGQTEEQSLNVLHRALKKAQDILGTAELESIKVIADSRYINRKLEAKLEEQFLRLQSQAEKVINQEVSRSQKEFITYLNDLKIRSEQAQLLNQEFIKQKTNDFFERFEQNLANFLTQTEQRSVVAIELELRAARQLVDTYKSQQLAMVDENIIAVLEQTLSIVLAKKLSLKEQVDLVHEALEKAKLEKFIV